MLTRRLRSSLIGLVAGIFILALFLVPSSPFHHKTKTLEGWYKHSPDLNASVYTTNKWFFEAELPEEWYPRPAYDVAKLKNVAPHNYKGPGHPTFATYFASRDGTLQDPYFLATQQMIYRLLWDPRSKSVHPFTIFVAPFIPQEQRDILAAAGAIVREIKLVEHDFLVTGHLIAGRLRDMFSKLEMWDQTDFSRIAYLDSDAFPIVNPDGIFDDGPVQTCKKELLEEEDKPNAEKLCQYVFGAVMEREGYLNAGVLLLSPQHEMYNRLIRESHRNDKYDAGMMEQALLNAAFNIEGAFPPTSLPVRWNGSPDSPVRPSILHAKLWALFWDENWSTNLFNDTWQDMVRLYNSQEFESLRHQDGNAVLNEYTKGVDE